MGYVVLPQDGREDGAERVGDVGVVQQHVGQAGVAGGRGGAQARAVGDVGQLDGHDAGDALGALDVGAVRAAAAALDGGRLLVAAHLGEQRLHVHLRLERLLRENVLRVEVLHEGVVGRGGGRVVESGGLGGRRGGGRRHARRAGRCRARRRVRGGGRVPGLQLGEAHELVRDGV